MELASSEKIKEIFAETLKISVEGVVDTLSYVEYDPWDSVIHMKIVAKLEQAFDLEFEMREIVAMETVAKVNEIVAKEILAKQISEAV